MNDQEKLFFMNHLANLKLNMSVAAYTKVPQEWRDLNFTPDFSRFYFIRDGEGHIKIGGDEIYPKRDQLLLLPAGLNQSYSTISDHTFTKYWCHFTATIGDINLFQLLKLPRVIDIAEPAFIEQQFQQLIQHHSSQELTSLLRVKSILTGIICYFIEHSDKEPIQFAGSISFEKVNLLLQYIEDHLHENMTINTLAKLVHFHPNYFIHFFHKMTGSSPVQYINRQKIEKAKQLLSETDLSITEVADRIGLQVYYFSKIFKNSTGFPPSGYRGYHRP